jgi:hypothetical protein
VRTSITVKAALTVLAAVATALAVLAPGASAAPSFRLRLPGPGQMTVAVAQARYTGKAPRSLKPRLKNRARLGHSYSGIYAVFRKRHGRVTALTFVTLLLHRDGPKAARESRDAGASTKDEVDPLTIAILLAGMHSDGFYEEEAEEPGGNSPDLFAVVQRLGEEAPIRQPKKMKKLLEYGNVDEPPPGRPGDLGDSLLDTGHYDDGHSFGWHTAGIKQAVGDWVHLSRSADAAYADLVERIERRLQEDFDGDGEVGGSSGKSGGTIETEVGAPVIK